MTGNSCADVLSDVFDSLVGLFSDFEIREAVGSTEDDWGSYVLQI